MCINSSHSRSNVAVEKILAVALRSRSSGMKESSGTIFSTAAAEFSQLVDLGRGFFAQVTFQLRDAKTGTQHVEDYSSILQGENSAHVEEDEALKELSERISEKEVSATH